MRPANIFTVVFFLALALPSAAQDPAPQAADLRGFYDKAFGFYMAGNYAKAIEQWNMILRADPKQITAQNMIEEARQKMAGSSASLKSSFYALVEKGRYSDALVKIETMLASDSTNPAYQKLQGSLRQISAVAPRKTASSKAWNAAAAGLSAWINEKPDLAFTYDALRYAQELDPADKVFTKLIALLEEEDSQLRLNDTKPAASKILDHKKELALRHIYDSKFYLAAKELEGVLRLEPQDIVALKRIGSVYLQLKDYRQARKAWQKAAGLAPDDEQLTEYLAALDKAAPAGAETGTKKPAARKRNRK
ncbi:MAG TPA: tetratricopeptide repeat protein [Elusimicrobiales bacterium]|nr:tetratricopeptide repeat protein [Elusimicrobiales bacterium]